jgi:hypothetical protein
MLPTNGSAVEGQQPQLALLPLSTQPAINSPGLQSVNNEQIDKRTFDIVRAGDQLSFKMSKQITP